MPHGRDADDGGADDEAAGPSPSPRGAGAARQAVALGVLLLGTGLTGAAVGGVLALRRGDDRTVAVVALLAAALLAVVLTVGAAVVLVRGVRPWWRLVVVPVVAVVVLVGTYVVALPVAVTMAAPGAPPVRDPAAVGLEFEPVTVASDGARLAAWFVPSRTGAAVVLLHGAGGTRASTLRQAEVLATRGYGVLLVDARGHGDSTGRPMLWGWDGDVDVPAAVAHLASRPGVDPDRIAVVGMSMGGEEAIGALPLVPQVRAVVAEGVTGRTAEDLAWLTDAYGWRGTLTWQVHAAQTALVDALATARRPPPLVDALRDAPLRPVLLVVAGQELDESHAAEALRRAAPRTVSVWEVPGAGHLEGLRTDPDGWADRVVAFLDDATGPDAGR